MPTLQVLCAERCDARADTCSRFTRAEQMSASVSQGTALPYVGKVWEVSFGGMSACSTM
jgi:hypothetical protein